MYNDHLEITNPGVLHFGITPEKLTQPHESKPWNPIIANVFYRAAIIERWGMGTLNILDWCSENGNPMPTWAEYAGSMFVTFFPASPEAVEKVTPQVGTKLALSRHQVEILKMCRHDSELVSLMAITGRTDRTKFRNQVLKPLIKEGLVEMTIPDKPKSRFQKYRLTEKGKQWLESHRTS